MKKNIATKWVKALRSGKYKQGYGRLHDPESNGYCCLGVLCKIYEKDYVGMDITLQNNDYLPSDIIEDFNISDGICGRVNGITRNGITIGKKQYDSLVEANDKNESFANIANWIEKNYALL